MIEIVVARRYSQIRDGVALRSITSVISHHQQCDVVLALIMLVTSSLLATHSIGTTMISHRYVQFILSNAMLIKDRVIMH